jgi:hypothetical protein
MILGHSGFKANVQDLVGAYDIEEHFAKPLPTLRIM